VLAAEGDNPAFQVGADKGIGRSVNHAAELCGFFLKAMCLMGEIEGIEEHYGKPARMAGIEVQHDGNETEYKSCRRVYQMFHGAPPFLKFCS
jgi:hypothetical protein